MKQSTDELAEELAATLVNGNIGTFKRALCARMSVTCRVALVCATLEKLSQYDPREKERAELIMLRMEFEG